MIATQTFAPVPSGASRAALSSLSLLDVDGVDACEFLHGQLSSDVKSLAIGAAQYASYNSPKGRMLATLIVWRRADGRFALVLASDLADAIKQRLSMFRLRAKVGLVVSTRRLWGVLGSEAARTVAMVSGSPVPVFASLQSGTAAALHLPDGRHLLDVGDVALPAITRIPVVDESAWRWCGIRAGVPVITAATSDRLVAQSANWELLGGVDFRKGCYPGQEIIARMQYLGRLKERLRAFHIDTQTAAIAGAPVTAAGRDAATGIVVNCAPSPGGGSDLLAVVQNEVADEDAMTVGGAALSPRALPYTVPVRENVRVRL